MKRTVPWLGFLAALLPLFLPQPVFAHGERNQEPFLRMRTAMFYDVKWSADHIKVNDDVVVTGKFRLHPDWPANLPNRKLPSWAMARPDRCSRGPSRT